MGYSYKVVEHLDTFLTMLTGELSDEVEVCVLTDNTDAFAKMANKYSATIISIPLSHVLGGLSSYFKSQVNLPGFYIPTNSGSPTELFPRDMSWLQEDMMVVYLGIGDQPPADMSTNNKFLRGGQISWFDLATHKDIERDLQSKITRVIEKALAQRRCERINLYHEPGAGGSTLGMRIIWELYKQYPCVILLRYNGVTTIDKLQKVFDLSKNPIVIMIDGSWISASQSDEINTYLNARNISGVMFQIQRRFTVPRNADKSFYLQGKLTQGECYRWETLLTSEMPLRRSNIREALASQTDSEKTPFYLGLVAFERDFVSLDDYVAKHISDLNLDQKKALVYLAIAYYYGQLPIDAQVFTTLFNIPQNNPLDFYSIFPDHIFRLIIQSDTDTGSWRPIHYLIAEKIIQQVLAGTGAREAWRTRLSDTAIGFIEFCWAYCGPQLPDKIADLLSRVFIFRDNTDFLNSEQTGSKRFAKIIADIQPEEGGLLVFKRLTELFPDESHFWAHLGRFYANQLNEYDSAVEAIDMAIDLCDDDPLLYHMKGMILRNWVYDKISNSAPLSDILVLARLAAECFKKARTISPQDEYGFISEAQLIIRVMEYNAKITDKSPVLAAAMQQEPFIRDGFDVAESLLDAVRRNHLGTAPSHYELRCYADLETLYQNHSKARETWYNLLSRPGVYAPPIRRQIVRTLLNEQEHQWSHIKEPDLKRICDLMRHNIEEESNNEQNIRLWFCALRYSPNNSSLEDIINEMAGWSIRTAELDAFYYLYVLYTLAALEGFSLAADKAERALERCRQASQYRRDKTKSHEWLAIGDGVKGLVNVSELGTWDPQENFWNDTQKLRRINGIIRKINGPASGTIEVSGIKIFFVPSVSGHSCGRSENQPVTFYLGFSYDGPRAWSVKDVVLKSDN